MRKIILFYTHTFPYLHNGSNSHLAWIWALIHQIWTQYFPKRPNLKTLMNDVPTKKELKR